MRGVILHAAVPLPYLTILPMFDRPSGGDRAVLVNLDFGDLDFAESQEEIRRLAESAGVEARCDLKGKRQRPDAATFAGSGKVEEIADAGAIYRCLAGVVQSRSVARAAAQSGKALANAASIDRSSLILDIFAQRARSHEGKLQVELAQLEHLATRLVRGWTHLERQKGGIGLRGPGETQLETDRQLLRKRVKVLKDKLATVHSQRQTQRRARLRGHGDVGVAGRLYQRRQVDAVQPAHATARPIVG